MASRTIEAKLVISGEDRGASASVAKVVQTVRQLEEAAKVSRPLENVAKSLLDVERASKAVDAAMGARNGFAQAEAGLKEVRATAQAAATALDQARKARAAFDGVKAAKGSEQALQIEAATKAVRELSAAHKRAEGDVRKATAAVAAQASTLQAAEGVARKLGADLGNLEGHQQRLRSATESATNAVRDQIRVEDQAARATAHHAREAAEQRRHMAKHGAIGVAASAAAGYVGVHSVTHEIGNSIKAGARYQHEVVALKNAGRTPEEMREISHASDATVRAVPTATFEENLKVINETTGAFGSLHHAIENLTFMQKSAAALHAAAGDKLHDGPGELGNKLARFFEMRGTAGNTEVFQKEAGEMIRAMVFTRGNFNPAEMVNFAQQAKASLPLYSERFLTKIVPSLVTEFHGERAGTGANAFRNVLMGKANDQKQAEEWVRLGLLDKSMARIKGGHVVSWKAGAVKGTDLALSDPLEWSEKVLLPALKAKGIDVDNKLELSKALGTLFRNSNANFFAEALAQQLSRTRLHKDEENINKAGTLDEVYARNLKEDPTEALKAVKAGIENLLTTASSPLMATAASGLNSLAVGLQAIAVAAKDHPNLAVAGGVGAGAAGLGAAGYASYKLMTGFGLPAAAAELTTAAKMLQGAAGAKSGAPAAAAAFGLGGITVAGGAVAGAYLDSNFGGNPGALGKLSGQEGDAEKSARFKAEQDAERRKGALFGERANLLDNLKREKELRDNLAKPDAPGLLTQGLDALGYGSAEERQKRRDTMKAEADKNVAEMEARLAAIDAKIKAAAAMPLPPVKPPDMSQVEAKATETGQQAGQSIANGVKDKAPEVQEQGLTIFQRLKETFSQGIFVPINLVPGGAGGEGGGSGVQTASFGGGGGFGGLIHRASFGGGSALSAAMSGRASGGNGGGGASIGFGSDYHAVVGGKSYRAAYQAGGRERVASWLDFYQRPVNQGGLGMEPDKARAMVAMMQGESGINLNPGAMGDHGTAFGTAQWRLGRARNLMATARGMGLDWRDPRAQQAHMRAEMLGLYGKGGSYRPVYDAIMGARSGEEALALGIDRFENPAKKALAYRFRLPYLHGLRRYGDKGPAIGRDVPRDAAAMDPRLVRGADGKEGLDLGDGTMRMPDGSVRPIPNHIPEPPPGGLGGEGRGGIGRHVEDFGRHVDRLADMGFHGEVQVSLSGAGAGHARVSGIKARGRNGMTADMGVSMPGAKDDPSDWL